LRAIVITPPDKNVRLGIPGPVLPLSAPHQIVSVYAGAENRAVIHHRPSCALCQRQNTCFHRYF
jgi:hypothetical protein